MKRSLLLILIFMLPYSIAGAFLGSWDGLNLYKKIDSGLEEYQDKIIYQELKWNVDGWTIMENLNQRLLENGLWECITSDPSKQDIENIRIWDLSTLTKLISDDCKNSNWDLTISWVEKILNIIKQVYNDAQQTANSKIQRAQAIESIWIYSDGIEENSGFDLITDIEEIDKIIFASQSDYVWESFQDLSQDNYFSDNWNSNTNSNQSNNLNRTINLIWLNDLPSSYNQWLIGHDSNNRLVCDVNNTWLSPEVIEDLFKKTTPYTLPEQSSWSIYDGNYTRLRWDDTYLVWDFANKWNYNKVSDAWVWPCNWFFCIKVDFITYNHQLLWGWENVTIEYLLNRSNKHLQKITSTSLLPSNMTVNNFELWFKNLDLSALLHLWVQISSKPVPFLEFPPEKEKDKTDFSKENMLEEYYKANSLDYQRRNDLQIFEKSEFELKSLKLSQNLNTSDAEDKINQLQNIKDKKIKKTAYIQEQIDYKTANSSIDELNKEFSELNQFTQSIASYIEELHANITLIKKIPTDTN